MEYKYRIAVLIAEAELSAQKSGSTIRHEAAEKVGLSYSQFNRLSRAKKAQTEGFSNEALEQLATYFKVKVEDLFNGEVKIKKERTYEVV